MTYLKTCFSGKSIAAVIFMALCSIILGYMQYLTPWQGDDLGYGFAFKDALEGNGSGIGWRDGWDFVVMHYKKVNGRVGDKLIVWVLTDLPKWLIALLSGLSCMSIFCFGSLAAFGSIRKHPLRACVLTGLLVCCLPWFVGMLMANMVLNYLWGTGLLAVALWLFLRPRKLNVWGGIALFLLSFLASGWHEASGVPVCAGMLLFLILDRSGPRVVRYVIFAGVLAGLIFTLTAPGFWIRKEVFASGVPIAQQTFAVLRGMVGGINLGLLVFTALPLLCFRGWRAAEKDLELRFLLMACVSLAAAVSIFFCSYYTLRTFWYADFVALVAVAMLYGDLLSKTARWLRRVSGLAFAGFVILHLLSACSRQILISRQYSEILKRFEASADGTVYYDYAGRGYGSWLNLRKAQIYAFLPEYRLDYQLLQLFYRNDWTILSIVPEALRNVDMSLWPRDKSAAIINGYAVSNDTALERSRSQCICPVYIYEDGKAGACRTIINPFRAADGTRLYYLEIDSRIADDKNLKDVKL